MKKMILGIAAAAAASVAAAAAPDSTQTFWHNDRGRVADGERTA